MRNSIALASITLVLGTPWCLHAEDPRPLAVGDRVRVTGPTLAEGPLVATLVGLSGDRIDFRVKDRDEPVSVARAAITRVERSDGRPIGKSALIGLGVGLFAGLLAGGVACSGDDCEGGLGLLIFSASGMALGTVAGAAIGTSERWTEIAVPPQISSASRPAVARGGVRIALRF